MKYDIDSLLINFEQLDKISVLSNLQPFPEKTLEEQKRLQSLFNTGL